MNIYYSLEIFTISIFDTKIRILSEKTSNKNAQKNTEQKIILKKHVKIYIFFHFRVLKYHFYNYLVFHVFYTSAY